MFENRKEVETSQKLLVDVKFYVLFIGAIRLKKSPRNSELFTIFRVRNGKSKLGFSGDPAENREYLANAKRFFQKNWTIRKNASRCISNEFSRFFSMFFHTSSSPIQSGQVFFRQYSTAVCSINSVRRRNREEKRCGKDKGGWRGEERTRESFARVDSRHIHTPHTHTQRLDLANFRHFYHLF